MLTQDSLVEPRRDLQNDNKMCLISGSDEGMEKDLKSITRSPMV